MTRIRGARNRRQQSRLEICRCGSRVRAGIGVSGSFGFTRRGWYREDFEFYTGWKHLGQMFEGDAGKKKYRFRG